MAPGLLEMPEVVMTKIMKDAAMNSMLTLRDVCHDLKNFIDDVKPDAKLEEIRINVSCDYDMDVSVYHHFLREPYYIYYDNYDKRCLAENYRTMDELLKEENFGTDSLKDLEIIFGHQKSVLKQFTVAGMLNKAKNDKLAENLQLILKSRDRPLKVEKFTAHLLDQNHLMSILPYLDSNTLKKIDILSPGFKLGSENKLEVDQLVQLDQWKNAQQLVLFNCWLDFEYIQHFAHFSNDHILFKSTHFPDLLLLKNLLLQLSGFKVIKIKPTNYDTDSVQQSMESLGRLFFQFNLEENFKHTWYYHIQTTNQILEITVTNMVWWSKEICIVLSRMNKVPRGAVIRN